MTTDTDTDNKPLTPEARSLGLPGKPITGIPFRLADGRDWLLPRMGNAEGCGELRDELYGAMAYNGSVSNRLLRLALWLALPYNYELSEEDFALLTQEGESFNLGESYDGQRPVDAILGAYIPSQETCEFGYDEWLRSSLLMNGLEPRLLNPDDLPALLRQLVLMGRCLPEQRFIAAAIAGGERREALTIARAQRGAHAAVDGMPPGNPSE